MKLPKKVWDFFLCWVGVLWVFLGKGGWEGSWFGWLVEFGLVWFLHFCFFLLA